VSSTINALNAPLFPMSYSRRSNIKQAFSSGVTRKPPALALKPLKDLFPERPVGVTVGRVCAVSSLTLIFSPLRVNGLPVRYRALALPQ